MEDVRGKLTTYKEWKYSKEQKYSDAKYALLIIALIIGLKHLKNYGEERHANQLNGGIYSMEQGANR